MFTWVERLSALLAKNRAALDKALSSQSPDDWQIVLETGKALCEFHAAHKAAGSPSMNGQCGSRSGESSESNL